MFEAKVRHNFLRWLPNINDAKFYRATSPLARIGCEITKSAATRWMTFTKSPSPIPRINPERKDSVMEYDRKDEGSRKDADASKWQPLRKFSPVKNEKGRLQRQGMQSNHSYELLHALDMQITLIILNV